MRTLVLNHFHTFHPDAQAEHDRLSLEEKRLTTALARRGEVDIDEPPKRRRMSDPPEDIEGELEDVRAQLKAQEDIVRSGIVRIVVKGLTRGEFRRMLVAHPPREGDPLDEQVGYNADTFGDALIQECILRTETLTGGPVDCEWDSWADDMTNGQWEEVFRACLKLTNDPSPSFPQ